MIINITHNEEIIKRSGNRRKKWYMKRMIDRYLEIGNVGIIEKQERIINANL